MVAPPPQAQAVPVAQPLCGLRTARSVLRAGGTPVTISLYLVDDHPAFRSYLQRLLERQPDLRVAGQADDGEQALRAAERCAPGALADVVLLDIALPGASGIDVVRGLQRLCAATRVLGLSTHEDPVLTQAMLAAGALRCLSKNDPLDLLLQAIRTAAAQPG